ncbi:MAG: phosphoglucomutase (alpha-D-glucose-1,6-bisphosphate-dependent) [Myxococcales bacterium]|nr:phosphoglucomutase (alpha-D-glucose-1,6-bisphosphate-dependent) [Polyangiaceae bacterium]MDW8249626.1 phosphoglucomutase (alpha-D-glucose-1,6-bisphosphate-dependent) [Myxococcales bacterium]
MTVHPLAGKFPTPDRLIDPAELVTKYYTEAPDPAEPSHRVSFGTSGHRGSAFRRSFNEAHLLAIVQAVCELRGEEGATGPLFLGMDSHALSLPGLRTAVEVLAANGVETLVAPERTLTATPLVSRAVLRHNAGKRERLADALLLTPSHNPPEDGGIKYNPPHGGPADTGITRKIEERANMLLREENRGVRRIPYERARRAATVKEYDYVGPYVEELPSVLDVEAIRRAGVKMGVNPLGGASLEVWGPVAERLGLEVTVVEPRRDPTFAFVPQDHDGKIRMDCSSAWAMSTLVELRYSYAVAFGNDTDADRHGIVTPSGGLMNPNQYLAVAIDYLFTHRPGWPAGAAVGKTLVSSGLIDRVCNRLGRRLVEVPVGFKWFVDGLQSGALGFGGEESAGASFLRRDGGVWTTDKDGILLGLLAAEILAVTGADPHQHYERLAGVLGRPHYRRIDAPATPEQKARLKQLTAGALGRDSIGGEPIRSCLTRAPGNQAEIGGIKVSTDSGWIAVRPSGTEDISKIYAESFLGEEHLARLIEDGREIVARTSISS